MEKLNNFGGEWTLTKLNILGNYLYCYTIALKKQKFKTLYIDGFAGDGKIYLKNRPLICEGSATLSLKLKQKFDKYIFIEKDVSRAKKLMSLKKQYPTIDIEIWNDDGNSVIKSICHSYNWNKWRCVTFLDPYATEVEWNTIVDISKTHAIDLWYLFPVQAISRMLKKNGEIPESWKKVINKLFGCDTWYSSFYKEKKFIQLNLFDTNQDKEFYKDIDTKKLSDYIIEKLKSIFPKVAENSILLNNSKNSPLFLLCFAVSNPNPKAYNLAIKMANDILKSY